MIKNDKKEREKKQRTDRQTERQTDNGWPLKEPFGW